MSHAIKALEDRLDRRLFDRAGRRVSLTAEGRSLAARVRLSLALLGDAFDVAPWISRDRLVVSTLAAIAGRILLPALAGLEAVLPGVGIDLRCTPALADVEGEVDVAIRFGPGGWSGLECRHLGDERLFPVASPVYRRGDLPRTVDDLRDCRLIHHPESAWRLWLDPLGCKASDFASALSIDDGSLALQAAADGHGVALARGRLAEGDLAVGRLVRLFKEEVPAEYGYWAVWSGGSPKRRLILDFVDWAARLFPG